jgi:hypothetical protein
MTTLRSKFQEITKQLQQLTVWRPNDRDPFCELDHWRTDAHTTIEQIYNKKRQQIEQIIDKHERIFMQHIARQRLLLNSIRQRLLSEKDNRTLNETSILTDLQKVENDIKTKLGRGEIVVKAIPLNIDDSVIIGLKTYLSATSSIHFKEMLIKNQPIKPHRSTDEVTRAFDNWVQFKKKEEVITARIELQSARQYEQYAKERRLYRQKQSEESYENWLSKKTIETKKKLTKNDNDIKQEINAT